MVADLARDVLTVTMTVFMVVGMAVLLAVFVAYVAVVFWDTTSGVRAEWQAWRKRRAEAKMGRQECSRPAVLSRSGMWEIYTTRAYLDGDYFTNDVKAIDETSRLLRKKALDEVNRQMKRAIDRAHGRIDELDASR